MSLLQVLPALAPFVASGTAWMVTDSASISTRQEAASIRSSSEIPWTVSLAFDLDRMLSLPAGWDGQSSVSPTERSVHIARSLVSSALEGIKDAAAPHLSPGGDGSIQLEWHEKHGELELLIEPDGQFSIWGRDHRNGLEFEDSGEEALGLFYRWAPWMASLPRHAGNVQIPVEYRSFEIAA